MRVISGVARGRRLATFKGRAIRPTSDKVRAAVFDILHGYGPFTRALDIFAGTGAMGIEALSRGVQEVLFIDSSRDSAALIRENLDRTGFSAQGKIMQTDALVAINLLAARRERYDLIFIDPPYDNTLNGKVLSAIDHYGLLDGGGIVVAESSRKSEERVHLAGLECFKEKGYGDTMVTFYRIPERV